MHGVVCVQFERGKRFGVHSSLRLRFSQERTTMELSDISDLIEAKIQESQSVLLNRLDTLMSSKLGNFQQQIKDNQRDLSDVQVAKIEEMTKDSYKFRKRGNEEQYKVNTKAIRKMKEANVILDAGSGSSSSSNIGDARAKISEGIEIMQNRQKLIKLADSSDAGWSTVDEYVRNCLAENSDDEKRIMRAEARAQKKIKSKVKSKKPQWSRRFPSHSTGSSSAIAVSSRGSTATPDIGYQRKPGACFACGKFGHWRNECRELTTEAGDSHKISETYDVLRWQMIAGQVQHPTPVGRLKSNLKKWEGMNANKNILSILQYGYKLPLFSLPEKKQILKTTSRLVIIQILLLLKSRNYCLKVV